ncbi:MAG: hypothetical protein ACRDC4_05165 [Plesiomonas sp.]
MDDLVVDGGNEIVPFDFSLINDDVDVDEPTDLVEEVVEDPEDEIEEAEEEAEEEVEEVEEEEVAEEEAVDEEVDFEGYEITLPNGENVVLSDLVQGYKAAEEVRVMREEVEAVKRDFEEKSGNMVSMLELARLEVDSVIQEYEDTDWNDLANSDPHAYAQHRSYFDKHLARSKELKKAMTELNEKKRIEEEAVNQEKVRSAIVRLQREIPGWGPEKFRSLVDYAVGMGGDEAELMSTSDPLVFLALNKAMEFEKGKQSVKAKVKRVGSPKKVVKATAKKPSVSKDANKEALIRKAEAEGDMATLFQFIKD